MKKQTVGAVILAGLVGLALAGALAWRYVALREKPADTGETLSEAEESGTGVPPGWKSVVVTAGQTAEASDKGIEVQSASNEDKPQAQATDKP